MGSSAESWETFTRTSVSFLIFQVSFRRNCGFLFVSPSYKLELSKFKFFFQIVQKRSGYSIRFHMILGITYTASQAFKAKVTYYLFCLKYEFNCLLWSNRHTIVHYSVFYLCALHYVPFRRVIQSKPLEGGEICWNCFQQLKGKLLKLQSAANRRILAWSWKTAACSEKGKLMREAGSKKIRLQQTGNNNFWGQNTQPLGKSRVNQKQGSSFVNTQ